MKDKKRRELKTAMERVEYLLEVFPETRDDDDLVRAWYLMTWHKEDVEKWVRSLLAVTYRHGDQVSIKLDVNRLAEFFKIGPTYETLRRARQRIQQEKPRLAGSRRTRRARAELEEVHHEFFQPLEKN